MRVLAILLESDLKAESDCQRLAQALLRYTPQVAVANPVVFAEIGKCRRLYSEESFLARVRALLKKLNLQGRMAIGDNLAHARALATYSHQPLPIDALQIYADPINLSASLEKSISILKNLGITTLQELQALPQKSLAARFGKIGLHARYHLDHAQNIPWPYFTPPAHIVESEQLDVSYQLRELDPLLFVLKKLVDRALLRTRASGNLVSALALRLKSETRQESKKESKQERVWTFAFSFGQSSPQAVLQMLRERLEQNLQRDPLNSPVERLEIEILSTTPGSFRQKDFFSKKEEEEESFRSIVARLSERLGMERVYFASPRASYQPERSWQKAIAPSEPFTSSYLVPERPLRLFPKPLDLRRVESFFIGRGRRWRIQEMRGPERISGDWWLGGEERDYFRVKTSNGEELWVYFLPRLKQYFLHGFFD